MSWTDSLDSLLLPPQEREKEGLLEQVARLESTAQDNAKLEQKVANLEGQVGDYFSPATAAAQQSAAKYHIKQHDIPSSKEALHRVKASLHRSGRKERQNVWELVAGVKTKAETVAGETSRHTPRPLSGLCTIAQE